MYKFIQLLHAYSMQYAAATACKEQSSKKRLYLRKSTAATKQIKPKQMLQSFPEVMLFFSRHF